jgi:hypothetical protein
MTKQFARKLTLALTLVVLTATAAGKAIAQSSTSTPPPSSSPIVTGTDPSPDYVGIILTVLHLA